MRQSLYIRIVDTGIWWHILDCIIRMFTGRQFDSLIGDGQENFWFHFSGTLIYRFLTGWFLGVDMYQQGVDWRLLD